ncbi:MAG: SDR family oxidoreductase [Bdellovibrionales bacterium]|nr:SDR family oxidoreductase [Bdellovibrionales bacterium]
MKVKTVLVTGASTGFGRLAAELLLHRGHRVIAALRGGQDRLEKVFPRAQLDTGRLHAVDLHLERPETFKAAVSEVMQKFQGRLDVLINNAGYGEMGPMEIVSEQALRRQLEVNFFGTVLLTQKLLPAIRQAQGRVLNVSSVVGFISLPFYGAYAASKFALEGYSEALWFDLRPFRVQVGLVEPGGFRTEFSGRVVKDGLPEQDPTGLYARRIERFRVNLKKKEAKLGADPMTVAKALVKLSEKRSIPLRTLCGKDARLAYWSKRLFPEWIYLRITNWIMRKGFFEE